MGLISKSNFKSYAANFWLQITLGFISIKEGNNWENKQMFPGLPLPLLATSSPPPHLVGQTCEERSLTKTKCWQMCHLYLMSVALFVNVCLFPVPSVQTTRTDWSEANSKLLAASREGLGQAEQRRPGKEVWISKTSGVVRCLVLHRNWGSM